MLIFINGTQFSSPKNISGRERQAMIGFDIYLEPRGSTSSPKVAGSAARKPWGSEFTTKLTIILTQTDLSIACLRIVISSMSSEKFQQGLAQDAMNVNPQSCFVPSCPSKYCG